LRDEEFKYQAEQLAREVQLYVRQATPAASSTTPPEGGAKKEKGATGKSNANGISLNQNDSFFCLF
jgi:hypothetical protein